MKRKLNIVDFAKLQGILFGLLGVVAGIIYAIGGLFVDIFVSLSWITSTESNGLSIGTLLAMSALIIMPLLFYIVGIITGFIEAVLYNFALRFAWLPYFTVFTRPKS